MLVVLTSPLSVVGVICPLDQCLDPSDDGYRYFGEMGVRISGPPPETEGLRSSSITGRLNQYVGWSGPGVPQHQVSRVVEGPVLFTRWMCPRRIAEVGRSPCSPLRPPSLGIMFECQGMSQQNWIRLKG